MFTGLVAAVGHIESSTPSDGGVRLAIIAQSPQGAVEPWLPGESVAVDGVCLTVTRCTHSGFVADVSGETLRLTTLGRRAAGDAINLERALRAGDRLGGHLVSGHVDGVGAVRAIDEDGLSSVYRFDLPGPLRRFVAVKGSIAVDGVSLTVNSIDTNGFSVNLIPHTLTHTTLGMRAPGEAVNIEVDQVARYVDRLLAVDASTDDRSDRAPRMQPAP